MCFLEKDDGEPNFLTDTSWVPGEEPTTCPIDSWACGAVPVRVETKDVSYRPISSPSEMGNTRASKTSHKGVNKTSGGSKRQAGVSNAGAGANKRGDDKNEKKGAKIVVRMAQPLNASGQTSASTSQNEAIRLAVEAERKLREEAKEKIAMNARLELENVNRLKKELRGKQYTYTSNGVLMLKPVNADRLPETTIVPSIITRKPVEDDQEGAADGKGAKNAKGGKTADKNKKKPVVTPGASTGPQQSTGSVGDKGKKAASTAAPVPTSLMGLYPDKRDATTYKPAESSQQPILEAVQLKSGVTIRVGNQVKQGAPQASSAGKRKLEMPALNSGNVMSAPIPQASQQQAAQAQAAAAQAAAMASSQQQKEQEKAAAQAAAAAAAAQAAAQAKAKEVALAAIREGRQAAAVTSANIQDGSNQGQQQKNQLIIIQNQSVQGGAGSQDAQNAAIAQARKQGINANNPELARLLAIQEEQKPHFTLSSMTPAVPVAEQTEIQVHPSHAFNAALVKQQNWGKMSDIRDLNPGQLPQRRITPEIKVHRERDIPAQHANYSFVSSSAVPEPLYTQKPPGAAFIVGQNQVGVSERYKYTNKQSALAAVESVAAVTGRMGNTGKIVDDKGNVLIENPDPGGLVDEAFVHSFNLSTKRVMAPMTATAGGVNGIGIPGKPLQSHQQQAVQRTHYTNMPARGQQYYSPNDAAQKRPLGEAISTIRELAMSTRLADPNNQVPLAESFVSVANANAKKPTVVASNVSQMKVNDIPQAHIFSIPQKYA